MADITEVLGTDLAHSKDLVRSSTGDLDTINGLANLKQALFHRLITVPGSLVHRPLYGVGIQTYQNAVNSLATQRQLALRIQEQFEEDPRVEAVTNVRVLNTNLRPELVTLVVAVKVVGYGEDAMTFTPFGEGV